MFHLIQGHHNHNSCNATPLSACVWLSWSCHEVHPLREQSEENSSQFEVFFCIQNSMLGILIKLHYCSTHNVTGLPIKRKKS